MGSVECVTCQVPVSQGMEGAVKVELGVRADMVVGRRRVMGDAIFGGWWEIGMKLERNSSSPGEELMETRGSFSSSGRRDFCESSHKKEIGI